MALEARRAAANERLQRQRGGVEPRGDVYSWMRIVYPALFLVIIAEGALRGLPSSATQWAGAAVFLSAKLLKWWAIVSLGACWTFRVIVVPGARLVTSGPYRYLRHPNYVAVLGELVGAGLIAGARISGPVAILAFGALMLKRIAVEDRALHLHG